MGLNSTNLILPDTIDTDIVRPENVTRRTFLGRLGSYAAAAGLAMKGIASADDHHTQDGLAKLRRESWESQNEIYEQIARLGMQKFYDGLSEQDKVTVFFTPEEVEAGHGRCACCSDEGNRRYRLKDETHDMMLIRTPGSGILLALDTEDKDPFAPAFLQSTAQDALNAQVTVFTGHKGCGAAKAVFNTHIKYLREKGRVAEAEKLEQEGSDAFAKRWADAVADMMRRLATPESAPHIQSDFITKLDRPAEIHVARSIYLTEEDRFNAANTALPQGFVEHVDPNKLTVTLSHADILRSIAFDKEHGFGQEFTDKKSERFFMISIAHTQEELRMLMLRSYQARDEMPKVDRDRVQIEGFVPNLSSPQSVQQSQRSKIQNLCKSIGAFVLLWTEAIMEFIEVEIFAEEALAVGLEILAFA